MPSRLAVSPFGGDAMILLINDQTARVDCEKAITRLREKRRDVRDRRVLAEIDADVDELLSIWQAAE